MKNFLISLAILFLASCQAYKSADTRAAKNESADKSKALSTETIIVIPKITPQDNQVSPAVKVRGLDKVSNIIPDSSSHSISGHPLALSFTSTESFSVNHKYQEMLYQFPVSEKDILNDFVIEIGNRKIRAIIRKKSEALKIMKNMQRAGVKSSLLTASDGYASIRFNKFNSYGHFKVRITRTQVPKIADGKLNFHLKTNKSLKKKYTGSIQCPNKLFQCIGHKSQNDKIRINLESANDFKISFKIKNKKASISTVYKGSYYTLSLSDKKGLSCSSGDNIYLNASLSDKKGESVLVSSPENIYAWASASYQKIIKSQNPKLNPELFSVKYKILTPHSALLIADPL